MASAAFEHPFGLNAIRTAEQILPPRSHGGQPARENRVSRPDRRIGRRAAGRPSFQGERLDDGGSPRAATVGGVVSAQPGSPTAGPTLWSVITAVHTLVYADDAEAARAFFRDVLEWPNVDAHGGWLIFRTGPSEMGIHPTSSDHDESPPTHPRHEIALMCDDISATVAALSAKGAEFTGEVEDQGFGFAAMMRIPGAGEMMLYQPKHPVAYTL
jgi:predicted enzyme related to lactoylglutathione lyase